jgi:hypothetical protein
MAIPKPREWLMNSGKTVFAQLMDLLPVYEFQKCVQRYHGDHRVKNFKCLDQFLCMAFAQLTFRESLRDIESCLRAMKPRLYHMGFRSRISRSTLADANEKRSWRIYANFAQALIKTARGLYLDEDFGVQLNETVYAFDSTTIDLCLSLFPWARFDRTRASVKMHTLLNLRGSIPEFIYISKGNVNDIKALDFLLVDPGAIYLLDRGYIDFRRLFNINQAGAFFVVRARRNLDIRRRYSRSVDKTTGLRSDQTVMLAGPLSKEKYPLPLRRISCFDDQAKKRLVFLTNNFLVPAETIAALFRARWRIEIFFKWIKQHLRIKEFFGTSENAVKTQIWIAVSVYVLVAILKKRLQIQQGLYNILQILSVTQFQKEPLYDLISQHSDIQQENSENPNQLLLFDL